MNNHIYLFLLRVIKHGLVTTTYILSGPRPYQTHTGLHITEWFSQ